MSLNSGPQSNSQSQLELAFANIKSATDRTSSDHATEMLIDAVGNNHAGTYCPVVLAAVPLAEAELQAGSDWARRAVLEALIDLCGSFEQEPCTETFDGGSLAACLKSRVMVLRPFIESIASGTSVASGSAAGLLEVL
jgi:hypothetical protein